MLSTHTDMPTDSTILVSLDPGFGTDSKIIPH
jgi:hypothetical protein